MNIKYFAFALAFLAIGALKTYEDPALGNTPQKALIGGQGGKQDPAVMNVEDDGLKGTLRYNAEKGMVYAPVVVRCQSGTSVPKGVKIGSYPNPAFTQKGPARMGGPLRNCELYPATPAAN